MLQESWESKKTVFVVSFLVYAAFAVYLLLNSVLFPEAKMESFSQLPFVADIYLAGALDVLFALVTAALLHVRYRGKIGKWGIGFDEPRLFIILFLFPMFVYGAVAYGLLSIAGMLGFVLAGLYFLKNVVFVWVGNGREDVLQRYSKTYGIGILGAMAFGMIFFATMFLTGLLGMEMQQSGPIATFIMVNAVTVYYAALAIGNFWNARAAGQPKH